MFGERTIRVPRGINSSSEYHLTYNNLEHISDPFPEASQPKTQLRNCLFELQGLDLGQSSEEAMASLIEKELSMHNKPTLCVSIITSPTTVILSSIILRYISESTKYYRLNETVKKSRWWTGTCFWQEIGFPSKVIQVGQSNSFVWAGRHYFQMTRTTRPGWSTLKFSNDF